MFPLPLSPPPLRPLSLSSSLHVVSPLLVPTFSSSPCPMSVPPAPAPLVSRLHLSSPFATHVAPAPLYRLENTLDYRLERVWALGYCKGSNSIAIGYDEGVVLLKVGKEEPVASMDSSGKVIWAKHSEVGRGADGRRRARWEEGEVGHEEEGRAGREAGKGGRGQGRKRRGYRIHGPGCMSR